MDPELSAFLIPLLWIFFAVSVLVSAGIGLMLAYHWARFGASYILSFFTIAVYAAGCVVLLGFMFGAALLV